MAERIPEPSRRQALVARAKPWLLPAGAAALAVFAAMVLWGKLRQDVWTYYTDGDSLRADAGDPRARPVLWQDPEPQVFQEEKNAGAMEAAFSADGTTMVIAREGDAERSADLYVSRWDGRVWSKPEPIDSVNTGAGERSPALSRDGGLLYFASDREGGKGGFDLYVARLVDGKWGDVRALPPGVNSSSNELGPALSPDDSALYFSSDRDGEGNDDIFVATVTAPSKNKKNWLPEFGAAQPVEDLNSGAADVQAAPSDRGDQVFIASDRDRDGKAGFKVYISRVIDGKTSAPEKVDLYIDEGDVTDPAVRMDGFDLLFSRSAESVPEPELYRSTTREVIGYTDLSRWEQFKQLVGNILWWILLALVALIALIYILERWNDITSLFHKCLAASAALHLIALLLAMLWLIAREIDVEETKQAEDIVVNIDALAEEELAMESIPQETEITETATNIESEKVESEFGAPGFEPQEDAQPMPEVARTEKEAVPVDVQPVMSETSDQPMPEAAEAASVLSELTATELPDLETPVLEERDVADAQPAQETSDEAFEPAPMTTETTQTETAEVTDSAIETAVAAAEVAEARETEPLAESPKESMVAAEAEASEMTDAVPSEQPPLESAMLSELDPAEFVDPSATPLEETNPATAENAATPADPTQDMFSPESAAANLATAPAQSDATADAAMTDAADAGAVASSPIDAESPAMDGAPAAASESASESDLPTAELAGGATTELPEMALADPGLPMLEEPAAAAAAAAAAESGSEQFEPGQAAANLATAPAESGSVADAAMSEGATAAEVVTGERVAESGASPTVASEAAAQGEVPPSDAVPGALAGLPDLALADPGTPMLEEPAPSAAAGAESDTFKPSESLPGVATARAPSGRVADSAQPSQAASADVRPAERVAESPVGTAQLPEMASSATPVVAVVSPLSPSLLPDAALPDPGDLRLEEPSRQPAAAASEMAQAEFKPTGSLPQLAVAKASGAAVADTAMTSPATAAQVADSRLVADSAVRDVRPSEQSAPAAAPASAEVAPPGGLPELALADPTAPKLEEPGQTKGGPAKTDVEQFKAGGIPGLATTQAKTGTPSDVAKADAIGSAAVALASRSDAASDVPPSPTNLEAGGSMPPLGDGAVSSEMAAVALSGLLPGKLDAPEKMGDPTEMAAAVRKQRGKPDMETIRQMGGSEGTEGAIGAAMEWLVNNQEPDGRWDTQKHGAKINYDSGGTGLVLLCFYGWGERHDRKCRYQQNVKKALDWLIAFQNKETGYLGGRPGMMYCHAIGTIALCEAYGVTKDKRLKGPAERAIAYTLAAQSKSRGGWRYNPGEDSDTSVTGWQFMALHSARMAGLEVPEEAFERARGFLDRMASGRQGGLYGYGSPSEISRAMVATGMFCRQLDLVPPSDPRMQESALMLKRNPMKLPSPDLYYVYYATLALYQHQGPIWNAWNARMEKELPAIQRKTGAVAGSWDPSASVTADGGRVVSTALATLSLEVYYRLLPMYGFRNTEADAPDAKTRE